MKKKIFIGISLVVIVPVILYIIFYLFIYRSILDKPRDIDFNYLCEIPISSNMENINLVRFSHPRLKWTSVSEYENLLGEVWDASDLSEDEIHNIKSLIENLPDDKYIYVTIRYKLERLWYTEGSDGHGHNGNYGTQEYDEIFIYWADEPLGNVIDGYV